MEKNSLKTMRPMNRNSGTNGNNGNNGNSRIQNIKMSEGKTSALTFGKLYSKEMASEETASRKCIERIPLTKLFNWKPHEKSMQMGYLAIMVADIPRWITHIITKGDIDLATWKMEKINSTEELVKYFDKSMKDAKKALDNVSDKELDKPFSLKREGKVLDASSKRENISSLINHWVHHRGQLTVYMRLNNIPVPSIYGPSADENTWG